MFVNPDNSGLTDPIELLDVTIDEAKNVAILLVAVLDFNQRKYISAVNALDQVLSSDKFPEKVVNLEDVIMRRGMALSQTDEKDRAISDFTNLMINFPNPISAYINRGITYYMLGEFDQAIFDFETALSLSPKSLPHFLIAHYNLGTLNYELGNCEQSAEHFVLAVNLLNELPFEKSGLNLLEDYFPNNLPEVFYKQALEIIVDYIRDPTVRQAAYDELNSLNRLTSPFP